ncbi:MAG: hypothetical protein ATN35_06670 [Epulopiscium sp. Nele67-Bin004]|nr:MAG: hypothetical protein ATN35_06670 [Epulopiscium sp. Nele67-Bin004]
MSIVYQGAIIHILDLQVGQPILSKGHLDMDDGNEKFITKHMMTLFENASVAPAQFKENSEMLDLIANFKDDKFIETSKRIASRFYNYMSTYGEIDSGDLLITQFIKEEINYLGILKLNYKEEYTHYVNDNNGLGGVTEMVKCKAIFPSSKQRITESILINLDTRQLRVLDKTKGMYLTDLFEIEKELSIRETLKLVEEVTYEVIEEHFENPTKALTTFKQNVADSIFETSEIPIDKVLEDTFAEHEEVKEAYKTRLEEYGVASDSIEIGSQREAKKYVSHKIMTNTGIEIKLPTEVAQDDSVIEFIDNPDGTISIMLKNIAKIISR